MKGTETAVLYVRVSSRDQKQRGYLSNKVKQMKDEAEVEGFKEKHVFTDVCTKYTKLDERDGMSEMLRFLKSMNSEHEATIFIEKLNRVGGNQKTMREFIHQIKSMGIKLFVLEENDFLNLNDWESIIELIKHRSDETQYQRIP